MTPILPSANFCRTTRHEPANTNPLPHGRASSLSLRPADPSRADTKHQPSIFRRRRPCSSRPWSGKSEIQTNNVDRPILPVENRQRVRSEHRATRRRHGIRRGR